LGVEIPFPTPEDEPERRVAQRAGEGRGQVGATTTGRPQPRPELLDLAGTGEPAAQHAQDEATGTPADTANWAVVRVATSMWSSGASTVVLKGMNDTAIIP
jgi:hypothetical protein